MKARTVIPAFIMAAVIFSGCSSNEALTAETSLSPAETPSSSSKPPSSFPTAASAPPTPERNERGQIIKGIGESALILNANGEQPLLSFKVTAIEPLDCDAEVAAKQPSGIALAVHLEIETSAEFIGPLTVDGTQGQISFAPHYWKAYTDDGTRMNTVETGFRHICVSDPTLIVPDYIGKAEKVSGIVVLDVTTPTGRIAFSAWDDDGWIWAYPSS